MAPGARPHAQPGARPTLQTLEVAEGQVGSRTTWKCRMMVQIRPRVSFGLPSAMSSFLMFTSFTCKQAGLSYTHESARKGAGACGQLGASPGGDGGSPGRSARSAACGSASSPSPAAARGACWSAPLSPHGIHNPYPGSPTPAGREDTLVSTPEPPWDP